MPLTNPHLISRSIASATGTVTAANQIAFDTTNAVGVAVGAAKTQTVLERLDGTGIGAAINTFAGSFTAGSGNINTWFGGRQQTRLRCTDDSGLAPVPFTLPGTTDLTTAFNDLVTAGLPEVLRFVIEFTDDTSTSFVRVEPLASPNPQIGGTSAIIIRSGVAATVEITRSSGVISDYVFQAIGGIGDTTAGTADALKLINPSDGVWDASASGPLPSTGVTKGNAYRVVNAPSDGSGRFSQRMRDGDRVVWDADTFTSWSALPAQWFVLPLEDIIRGSALDEEFLTYIELSPQSDRNTILRGANYADSAGEIRLKLYNARADYSAADLNTTGDIDEFTDPSDANAFLGIRFSGNQAALASTLPTLYVYAEDGSGNFTRLLNLDADFTFEGDFGAESDYLSREAIVYNANDTLRVYFGSVLDRFTNQELDISYENLDADLQARVGGTHPSDTTDGARISSLEGKVAALFPLTPDVNDLTAFSDIFDPAVTVAAVNITDGYSLIADYRGAGTRYESAGVTYDDTGTNVVRYTGLGDNLFRTFGFKVNAPADQVLMWIVDGSELIPFIDMTVGGNYRINAYTPSTTEDQVVTNRFFTLTNSGTATLSPGTGDVATWTITAFPANAVHTSRYFDVNIDILVNGTDTLAGHNQTITLPADNTAQAQQTFSSNIYLGPLYSNRTVSITMGYTLRVSGSDLLIDLTLLQAPSDVTVQFNDGTFAVLSYTAPAAVARVDNFQILNDGASNYTFTGTNELLITFHPFQQSGIMNVVPAAVNSTGTIDELNDVTTPIPEESFASVEIPDQTALTGFEFRTFSPVHYLLHSDLAHLLTRRTTQWAYGLALNTTVTDRQITEAIDFTQGIILVSPDSSRWLVSVDDTGALATTKQP